MDMATLNSLDLLLPAGAQRLIHKVNFADV